MKKLLPTLVGLCITFNSIQSAKAGSFKISFFQTIDDTCEFSEQTNSPNFNLIQAKAKKWLTNKELGCRQVGMKVIDKRGIQSHAYFFQPGEFIGWDYRAGTWVDGSSKNQIFREQLKNDLIAR